MTGLMPVMPREIAYLLLIFGLMVVPRVLQRYRIPAPLSSFALGMVAAAFLAGASQDATLALLATLGISSLFLFAGLEVDLADFGRGKWPLLANLLVLALTLMAVVDLTTSFFGFSWKVAALLGLAVIIPSTGFILDTLSTLELNEDERYWVRMKAVSGELFALLVMFVVLQSDSAQTLVWSSLALVAMMVGLPLLFIGLGRLVIPHARGSEFSLLMMVGVLAAFLTYKLGVYYLVGAFLAGFIAKLLRQRMPLLASDANLHAIRMFASFFVPFYFFYKGMNAPVGGFNWQALGLGLLLTLTALPLRVGLVWLQRRLIRGETAMTSLRVAAALMPTLVFTLVLAEILRERYHISEVLYGALLVYAGISTILPSILMTRPVDFNLDSSAPGPGA